MTDSAEMHLVFRLAGIGFVLPIDDLVEIREATATEPSAVAGAESGVVALHGAFELVAADATAGAQVVLCGHQKSWVLQVDGIDGIFPGGEFDHRPLPELLQRDRVLPCRHLALWRGELLHACRALQLEPFRGGE